MTVLHNFSEIADHIPLERVSLIEFNERIQAAIEEETNSETQTFLAVLKYGLNRRFYLNALAKGQIR